METISEKVEGEPVKKKKKKKEEKTNKPTLKNQNRTASKPTLLNHFPALYKTS